MVQPSGIGVALGQVSSLGQIPGRLDAGYRVIRPAAALPVTTYLQVLEYNPLRKWAMIQNLGATCTIALDDVYGTTGTLVLPTYSIFQIDDNTPWTGPVTVWVASGSVTYIEASIVK